MMHTKHRMVPGSGRTRRRRLVAATATVAVVAGAACVGAMGASAAPDDPVVDPTTGWRYTKESIETGQGFGFQLALDPVTRKVYLSDMTTGSHRYNTATAEYSYATQNFNSFTGAPGGEVIVVDAATRQIEGSHDFTGLSRIDGSGPANQHPDLSFFGAANAEGIQSYGATRTDWGAYGVDIDPYTYYDGVLDPTIVTTQARQQIPNAPVYDNDGNIVAGQTRSHGGGLVVYRASQGGPTDADVIYEFDDGAPVFQGPRRVAINAATHKAYVTSLGTARNNGPQPGFITEVDLLTKTVTARIALPAEGSLLPGTVGVAVDVENNLIYAGAMQGTGLYVIDGDAINRANPKSVNLNAAAVTKLDAVLDDNQRPTYSPADKRLYISQYDAKKVSIVDADPASATYGHELHEIIGVDTNSTLVDGERGLLFSADLKDFNVKVYDTTTFEQVLTLPTSGQALNMAIDPGTGDLWVSNWGGAGWSAAHTPKVDVFSLTEVTTKHYPDGAVLYIPTTWTEGEPLVITGENYLTLADNGTPAFPDDYVRRGSVAAAKLGRGSTNFEPVDPWTPEELEAAGYNVPGTLSDIWDVVEADAEGNLVATIEFPSATTSANGAAAVGDTLNLFLLTGSMFPGGLDQGRGGTAATLTVVAAGSSVAPPTDPGDPDPPLQPGQVTVSFDVDAAAGGLSLAVSGTAVDLGTAEINPGLDKLTAYGVLPDVTVADTRANDLGWSASGSVGAFEGAPEAKLGWTPRVLSATTGQTVVPGSFVHPANGIAGGAGLATGTAGSGKGTAVLGADLILETPTNTPAGEYSSVVTLTIS